MKRRPWFWVLIYLALAVLAVFYLIPVYVLVVNALKDYREVSVEAMWRLPDHFSLASFAKAWYGTTGMTGLSRNFMNSIYLVVPAVFFSVLLGSINGYVLAHWRFRGSETLFFLLLFGMFIPYQSVLIPLVRVLMKIHLYGTLPGLIITHIVYGIPITTLIFRNYYAQIPRELIDAAQIDGAEVMKVYRYVILPISAPGMVVAVIWQFTQVWNDFLFGVVITNRPDVQPITVALNNMAGSFIVEWNVQMAGALLAALPTLLVYLLMGRYFIRGLLAGSVKG